MKVSSLTKGPTPTKVFVDKLYFPTQRRSAKSRSRGLIYRTYQGGENTYFDFVLIDEHWNEYIGTFGFKDDGDVSPEYITRFVAFLHEAYGFPFTVKHTVAKDGTVIQRTDAGEKPMLLKSGDILSALIQHPGERKPAGLVHA